MENSPLHVYHVFPSIKVCFFTVRKMFVVHNCPAVLIDKKNITSARSHKLRFEPRSTTQLLSNVMKIKM